MKLDRTEIARRIPHAGAMRLLDTVVDWNDKAIYCQADAPGADHPLARAGSVPSVAAAEYAAQAVEVHGALLDGVATPRAGVLAKLSDIVLHAPCLPSNAGALVVRAELLSRAASGCLYRFEVGTAAGGIASGRLLVAFTDIAAT